MTTTTCGPDVVPRTPHCAAWCARHCRLDDGTTFCMAADLPVYAHQSGGTGHVALMRFPGEAPYIDVSLGGREDLLTVDEAEQLARAILAQVAAARTTTGGMA